ncbi:MAG TPA: hypothetical protein VHF69_13860 [Candidatus Synoicihabitans sp.]|nr:hypothetical protein [Candidatus Synoicihabitans sp.]
MATTDNVLVPLPGVTLPRDLPWRAKFVELVEDHLRRLSAGGGFTPPRFFGYYFRGDEPVAVTGSWTVLLERQPLLNHLPETLDALTCGQFNIRAPEDDDPEFMLIHDRHDGACWLWRYAYGLRFVMASEPVLHDGAA